MVPHEVALPAGRLRGSGRAHRDMWIGPAAEVRRADGEAQISDRQSSECASRRTPRDPPSRPRWRTARRTNPLRLEVLAVVTAERAVREPLQQAERDGTLRREQLRDLAGLVEHGIVDPVDEADPERLVGIDVAPPVEEVLGDSDANEAGQALRPAPAGNDAEVDLRLAELRGRGRVADVTRERELAAAAESEAVDRGDRRLRHRLEQPRGLVGESAPRLRLVDAEPAHVLDVRAGDERLLACAREDDDACPLVVGEIAEAIPQRRQRLEVERVQRVLPIDGDHRDRVLPLDVDHVTGILPLTKSTMPEVGAPGVKTSATPSCFNSSASSVGIVPPTITSTSSAPFSFNPSTMRGTSVM